MKIRWHISVRGRGGPADLAFRTNPLLEKGELARCESIPESVSNLDDSFNQTIHHYLTMAPL